MDDSHENNWPAKSGETPPDLPVFDITTVNLVELGRQLKSTLAAKRPGWIFLKKRGNEKAILDEEHMRALLAQIEDLRDMNSALLNLNAEVYLTQERMARIIQRYREQENFVDAEGRRLSEMAEKRHQVELAALDDAAVERALRLKAMELENQLKMAQIEQLRAAVERENQLARARIEGEQAGTERIETATREIDARAEFIKKALEAIDIAELPPTLQTYITSAIFNPHGSQFQDFDLQEQLKEFIVKKEKAQADRASAEAQIKKEEKRSVKAQADIDSATAKKAVFDFERIKKEREEKED
jgi:hypothetical protein